jgi:hypothetical protein
MQTTLITVTTHSFAKKVSVPSSAVGSHPCPSYFDAYLTFKQSIVWIGPLVVKELKRIVESSEIVK